MNCPVCKNQMFIIGNKCYKDTFNGVHINYDKFYQCPRCNIYNSRNVTNGKWELGMQRLKIRDKWYYFSGKWIVLRPLTDSENAVLKIPLNTLDELVMQKT